MTLDEVRVNIDRVDNEIKQLFKERMQLADQVAQVKAETGDDIFKPEREEIIINRLTADVDKHIVKEYKALIKRMMEVSRKYQYGRTLELRDCLDISYSEDSYVAAKIVAVKDELYLCNMYDQNAIQTVSTFEEIGRMIMNGQADAGIGVLEEISRGTSDALHQLLVDNHLYIYRCDIVKDEGIQKKVVAFADHFIVQPEDNRLKLMFTCRNQSGSLARILSMIADYGVNLTEIHSRSNGKKEWNYEFFVELEANFLSKEMQAMVFQLKNETMQLQILGSYICREEK